MIPLLKSLQHVQGPSHHLGTVSFCREEDVLSAPQPVSGRAGFSAFIMPRAFFLYLNSPCSRYGSILFCHLIYITPCGLQTPLGQIHVLHASVTHMVQSRAPCASAKQLSNRQGKYEIGQNKGQPQFMADQISFLFPDQKDRCSGSLGSSPVVTSPIVPPAL